MKMFITASFGKVAIEVLQSIQQQGIEPEIIDCTYLPPRLAKSQMIILSEKKFKEVALRRDDDFIIYQQSDILHLKNDNLAVMKQFLINNTDFGAIALSRYNLTTNMKQFYDKVEQNTIVSGCTMFTRQSLEKVQFDDLNNFFPSAYNICSSLDDANLKYGYVDKTVRIKHLKD